MGCARRRCAKASEVVLSSHEQWLGPQINTGGRQEQQRQRRERHDNLARFAANFSGVQIEQQPAPVESASRLSVRAGLGDQFVLAFDETFTMALTHNSSPVRCLILKVSSPCSSRNSTRSRFTSPHSARAAAKAPSRLTGVAVVKAIRLGFDWVSGRSFPREVLVS